MSTNINSTNITHSSKRATKKFFLYVLLITFAIALVLVVTEVLGFFIETFTAIPILFKVTLGTCYIVATTLMAIFIKKHKFIVLLLWTLLALGIYLVYAICQFPQEFISNLYFPQEFAGGYLVSFIVTVFSYCFAFNVFKRSK